MMNDTCRWCCAALQLMNDAIASWKTVAAAVADVVGEYQWLMKQLVNSRCDRNCDVALSSSCCRLLNGRNHCCNRHCCLHGYCVAVVVVAVIVEIVVDVVDDEYCAVGLSFRTSCFHRLYLLNQK